MDTATRARTTPSVAPLLAALSGAAVFIVTFVAAGAYQNTDGNDSYSLTQWAVTAALLAAAVAGALHAARLAERGDPAKVALVLAVVAAATFVAFWSGVMHVLAAEAGLLAFIAHVRQGRWTVASLAALGVAGLTLAAGIVLVVVG